MIDNDMNCIRSLNYQGANSPHTPWNLGNAAVKDEPMDEKNDSGVASGSEVPSPGSDTFQQFQARFFQMIPQPVSMFGNPPYPTPSPLTPPSEKDEKDTDATLTPCSSPNMENHLRSLQISVDKNTLNSSKVSEHSMDELSIKSDDADEYVESLRVPKVNSHGKLKIFKCKQCDFVSKTKIEQWEHLTIHIPEHKRLTCPRCPFITEYKHHLEYHIRNHSGSKPFRCKECEYSCVNKSMLNSHMKSHSNVYRFRCRDCTYATKYCHSLKLHLRRYKHSPNVVLDEKGNPCPEALIDVYGTRRGPKVKATKEEVKLQVPQIPFPYPFYGANPLMLQQLIRHSQVMAEATQAPPEEVLDLSQGHRSRRKGKAYRVDPNTLQESEEDEESTTTMFSNVEVVQNEVKKEEDDGDTDSNNGDKKTCQYCHTTYGDDVLYNLHMGFHGFNNPFTCNKCGIECTDKVTFFLHIACAPHS